MLGRDTGRKLVRSGGGYGEDRAADLQDEFCRLDKRTTKFEERMARIESAIFFGPATVRDLKRGQYGKTPDVTKELGKVL